MTEFNLDELIADAVDADMTRVSVQRTDKCGFSDECHSPASHASTFDGTPLCPAHVDSYMLKMRTFFETQERARWARVMETKAAQPNDGEKENDEPEAVSGETGPALPDASN